MNSKKTMNILKIHCFLLYEIEMLDFVSIPTYNNYVDNDKNKIEGEKR